MEQKPLKERVRGVPRQGGMLKASAILLMAGPVTDQLLDMVLVDYHARITLFLSLLTIVGGVLLLTAKSKRANWMIGGALALLGAAAQTNQVVLLVSLAAWVVSAQGVSWNKVPGSLPDRFRMPLLNLVATVLAVLSALLCLQSIRYLLIRMVPTALAAVGAILLCGNVEAETFMPASREERAQMAPGVRYRSVPAAGTLCLVGALLVLADGLMDLANLFMMESFEVRLLELLWPLLVIAAGVLLVRGDRDKHVLPASALLLACQLRMLFVLRQVAMYSDSGIGSRTPMAALLFGAELMMLLGAVGFTWNRPVGKRSMPLISAIAAALAGANAVWAEVIELDFLVEYFQIGGQGNPGLFRNLITVILLPLGLILVNLAMECREAPPKVWKVDGDKYRRGFSGFVHGFYSDVGGKIQLVAKICGLIYLILGLLGVAVMALSIVILLLQLFGLIPPYFSAASLLLSGLIAVVSALVLAAGTWPLYAFGQMTADVHAIRKEGVASVKTEGAAVPVPDHSAERTNPDELPEL